MSILETILKSQGGGLVKQVAGSLNLDEAQAGAAVAQLLPALTQGIKTNVQKPSGLESLLGEDDAALFPPAFHQRHQGLGHLLGSKDVSRKVAADAAAKTGVDVDKLKQMLPMIATMAMGTLSKESSSGGLSALMGGGGDKAGAMGMLSGFLDKDGDGSMADDLLGFAKKLF